MSEVPRDDLDVSVWQEFDLSSETQPDKFQELLTSMGISKEHVDRLLRRGMLVNGISHNMALELGLIEGGPAAKNWEYLTYSGIDPYSAQEQWNRFFNDAYNDADDDHFRAQYPELH